MVRGERVPAAQQRPRVAPHRQRRQRAQVRAQQRRPHRLARQPHELIQRRRTPTAPTPPHPANMYIFLKSSLYTKNPQDPTRDPNLKQAGPYPKNMYTFQNSSCKKNNTSPHDLQPYAHRTPLWTHVYISKIIPQQKILHDPTTPAQTLQTCRHIKNDLSAQKYYMIPQATPNPYYIFMSDCARCIEWILISSHYHRCPRNLLKYNKKI